MDQSAAGYIARLYRLAVSNGLTHSEAVDAIPKPARCSSRFDAEFDRSIKAIAKDERLQQYWEEPHAPFTLVRPAPYGYVPDTSELVIPPQRIDTSGQAKKLRKRKRANG